MKMHHALLLGALIAGGSSQTGRADEPKSLGDDGYAHAEMHDSYQALFPTLGCSCGVGECRPTNWKPSRKSPKGYAVWLDGKWYDLPETTKMADPMLASPLLRGFPAHVCAYGTPPNLTIPCALITSTGS